MLQSQKMLMKDYGPHQVLIHPGMVHTVEVATRLKIPAESGLANKGGLANVGGLASKDGQVNKGGLGSMTMMVLPAVSLGLVPPWLIIFQGMVILNLVTTHLGALVMADLGLIEVEEAP